MIDFTVITTGKARDQAEVNRLKDNIGGLVDPDSGYSSVVVTEGEGWTEKYVQFIKNGIEFGYIRIPEKGDPARDTIDHVLSLPSPPTQEGTV